MESIELDYSDKLIKIKKVLDSVENQEQYEIVSNWILVLSRNGFLNNAEKICVCKILNDSRIYKMKKK